MRFLCILLLLLAMQSLSPVAAQKRGQDQTPDILDRKKLYRGAVLDTLPAYIPRQLIVNTKAHGYLDNITALRNFIRDLYNRNLDKFNPSDTIINISKCGNCGDFSLWEGNILQTVIDSAGEKVRTGAKPTMIAQGISPNFVTNLPKSSKWFEGWGRESSISQASYSGDAFKIAVFDSGLDTTLVRGYTKNFFDSCYGANAGGWNVGAVNPNFFDDSHTKHGTIVTRLIIDELQKLQPNIPPVQIIPVKVLNDKGQGTLFDFLCGLNYAAKAGAKVINASLGFYYYHDSIPGFEEYIDSVLTVNKIMMFSAAGNKQFKEINFGDYSVDRSDIRNIDSNYFYPGGLSARNEQLVCITTANKKGAAISPHQNYSPNRVNIAVGAEKGFCFKHPFKRFLFCRKYIAGSSFATPIFAGKYIAWLHGAGSGTAPERQAILNLMNTQNVIQPKAALQPFIKNGNFINR